MGQILAVESRWKLLGDGVPNRSVLRASHEGRAGQVQLHSAEQLWPHPRSHQALDCRTGSVCARWA